MINESLQKQVHLPIMMLHWLYLQFNKNTIRKCWWQTHRNPALLQKLNDENELVSLYVPPVRGVFLHVARCMLRLWDNYGGSRMEWWKEYGRSFFSSVIKVRTTLTQTRSKHSLRVLKPLRWQKQLCQAAIHWSWPPPSALANATATCQWKKKKKRKARRRFKPIIT